MTTEVEAEETPEATLQELIHQMNRQKLEDDMGACVQVVEVLHALGIYATFAQVWEEQAGNTRMVFSVVIPMAGLEELKNIITKAIMADAIPEGE